MPPFQSQKPKLTFKCVAPKSVFQKRPLATCSQELIQLGPQVSPAATHSTCGCTWTVLTPSTPTWLFFPTAHNQTAACHCPLAQAVPCVETPFQLQPLYSESLNTPFKPSSDAIPSKNLPLTSQELTPCDITLLLYLTGLIILYWTCFMPVYIFGRELCF